jgi:hypothetical protein
MCERCRATRSTTPATRVVSGPAEHPAVVKLDHLVRSPLTIAADLVEHDGVREKGEAVRCLADLHGTVAGSGAVH